MPSKAFNATRFTKIAARLTRDVKNAGGRALIVSSAPERNRMVERILRKKLKNKYLFVPRDIAVPLRNRYATKATLGADRLVNAYAAQRLYGAPAVIFDFGTAITADCVSGKKEYLGGLIMPGITTSFESLLQRAPILKKYRSGTGTQLRRGLKENPRYIADTSRECLEQGIIAGNACMVQCLYEKYKKLLGKNTRLVVTGGEGALLTDHLKREKVKFIYDPLLTIKGIGLIYEENNQK
jgi:type III pantothenate kinase